MNQARIDQGALYLREAYDLNVKLYGPDGLRTAGVMVALADLAYRKGDYAAGEPWVQKALPIFRKHVNDADFEIQWMAQILSDAAFAKRAMGRFDDAEALWLEALSYAPRLPARYRGLGIAPKTFLTQLYVDRGDVAKADPLASEASQELRALGSDLFTLAQSLIDLGNVRRLEGRYTEAEPLIQEGTRLYAQLQGADHPNVAYGLWILSALHYYQGSYDVAEQNARGVLRIVEKLPKGTSYYGAAYGALGRVLNKTGRSKEAEPLLREALAIRQKSPRRNDIALALGSLGECLTTQKRYAEAEPVLVESYETLKSLQVPQSPLLKEARERLASFYAAWGKPAPAGL
jgi:tetratricopeptide (TPR) repeat protein